MSGHQISVRAAVALAVLALFAVVFEGVGSHSRTTDAPVVVFDVAADPGEAVPVVHQAALEVSTLRTQLDSLLSQHVVLVAALAHAVDAGDDNPTAAVRALTKNSQALTGAIATVYGPDAGRAFEQIWEQHTQFFVDYAQAARAHDGGKRGEAINRLNDYQNDFASFLSTATDGSAPIAAVSVLLHGHVEDLLRYIDDDVAGKRAEAEHDLQQAVGHMRVISRTVANAIAAHSPDTIKP
jgi:hypothetical protein